MHLFLPLLLVHLARRPPSDAAPPAPEDPWLREVLAQVRDAERAFRREGEAWVTTSPKTGVRGRFALDGAWLVREGARIRVWTTRWGHPGAMAAAVPAALRLGACAPGQESLEGDCDRRVEIISAGLTETWANTAEGFEQTWTVDAPPGGGGDLAIEVGVEGADVEVGDGDLWLDGEDGEVWLVRGFSAWDAEGVPLPVRLEATAEGFRVQVRDETARYPVTVDPIYGTAATTLTGEEEGDEFGYAVSSAGDVDGDGYDDVIVGAYVSSDTGRAYVFHGSADGVSSTATTTLTGEAAEDRFGYAVSSAGDVNGDGYDDVIVGAPFYDDQTGRVYVYLGSSSGVLSTAVTTLTGEDAWSRFGVSVSGAGDTNGDGYDDLVVGAEGYGYYLGTYVYIGRAYVYEGSASGASTAATTTLTGEDEYGYLGCSVSGAGDVNGDGFGDVVVGAWGYGWESGAAYVFHGSSDGVSNSAATMLLGDTAHLGFGRTVSGAGDVDGDGYDDVIVGVRGYDESTTGRAYVYHGSASGVATTATTMLWGESEGDRFGYSVSDIGDIDGDTYDDVMVGAPEYSSDTGRAYVYRGSASGVATSASTVLTGETAGDVFGHAVSSTGDVNGDGFADFIVGAYGYDDDAGRAYVYHSNVDGDGDGYLSVDDCDDADADTYPGADEVTCDGVDQDCDGSDLRDACDTGEPPDTDSETGETGDTDTDDSDTTDTEPGTDDTDGGDTEDTEPGDGHSADGSDTSDKEPPTCGCASLGPARGSLLLTLLALFTLRRRSRASV